jgi:hypothetical protein
VIRFSTKREFRGRELELDVEAGHGSPGCYSGPPESCYEAEAPELHRVVVLDGGAPTAEEEASEEWDKLLDSLAEEADKIDRERESNDWGD